MLWFQRRCFRHASASRGALAFATVFAKPAGLSEGHRTATTALATEQQGRESTGLCFSYPLSCRRFCFLGNPTATEGFLSEPPRARIHKQGAKRRSNTPFSAFTYGSLPKCLKHAHIEIIGAIVSRCNSFATDKDGTFIFQRGKYSTGFACNPRQSKGSAALDFCCSMERVLIQRNG